MPEPTGEAVRTREALVEALRAHIAEVTGGGYLADFVLAAAAVPPASGQRTDYVIEASEGPVHHQLGLVRYLTVRGDELITAAGPWAG